MIGEVQKAKLSACGCELDFSRHTRQLYATDASIYQIEPVGVAFPRSAAAAGAVIQSAAEAGFSVIPRGAGTGLVGGAIGDGVVVDFARHNLEIRDFNRDKRTVRVGAGVVLDRLNEFLQPHGLMFGPDVATSSRATLGGMIANNSSGARAPIFGCAGDHVISLELVLADGRVIEAGKDAEILQYTRQAIKRLLAVHREEIRRRLPHVLPKRWPGYGLERCLRHPDNVLTQVMAGSEGTLAGIWSAELNLVPIPREKGLALIFFGSVIEAMQATVELLDLKPAAIEHVDRILFDQTKGQLAFQAARDLLELDAKPCEAFLIVEFFDDVQDRLRAVADRKLGQRIKIIVRPAEMQLVWALRKAGLSLLTGCKGPAKPTTCIEDASVRPEQLPEFVRDLQSILNPLQVPACYYGHAVSGLLHMRPVLDLHTAEGVKKLRLIGDEVSALVRRYKGSLAAEHGVGIARTEYLPQHLGETLMDALRHIKELFDPRQVLNPGKIIPDGRYKIDTHLRQGAGRQITLPFEPLLAYAARDGSFIANLEQCNGCGGCLKQAPTMCPTFPVTREEGMSTRGRANTIRAALEGRLGAELGLVNLPELDVALSNCLSCKACATECPSNVNLALLKADLLQARYDREGLPLRARMIGAVDLLGKAGCLWPGPVNWLLGLKPARWLMEKTLGISSSRPLPRYANERFDHWFARRTKSGRQSWGKVILWDDTFVRYHDPHIGRAAVKVLEAAGFEVTLLPNRVCCGRPAFSQGNLRKAARLGQHNLDLLVNDPERLPVIFLEPSCWAMFAEDYRELKLRGAEEVAPRCFLFEQFIGDLLASEPRALPFKTQGRETVAIHAHCQAKALVNPGFMVRLVRQVPGAEARLLDTGCCGMAGAFGSLTSKYDLSVKVAEPLLEQIAQLPHEAALIASGTSCRHQIEHLAPKPARHLAEWLAERLVE